jgi:phosphopantothenoylcysteine decarboxylase / phosphopantothenate---cysteine ligase
MDRSPKHALERLAHQRITLCVTGSVAAYKAVLLARLLLREGADVEVVLTRSAQHFVGAATFAGLTRKRVYEDMFDPSVPGEVHVELAARSDLLLIVPATADALARLASGRADDLLTALVLCATCPVLAAPAMHPSMWDHPATRRNVATLAADGRLELVGPVEGDVASGAYGVGRMAEPEAILERVIARFVEPTLRGRQIVISAGPTQEDVDPVRFIGDRSSGKMGFALAERAAALGATTTLITGPVHLDTPPGVRRIDVRSTAAMRSALWHALGDDLSGADALIMAAAVADYRPAEQHSQKLKRGQALTLALVPNPDLLAEIGRKRTGPRPVLVGFALETAEGEALITLGRDKFTKKGLDLLIANSAADALGTDTIRAELISANGNETLGPVSKELAAARILAWIETRLGELSP